MATPTRTQRSLFDSEHRAGVASATGQCVFYRLRRPDDVPRPGDDHYVLRGDVEVWQPEFAPELTVADRAAVLGMIDRMTPSLAPADARRAALGGLADWLRRGSEPFVGWRAE